MQRFIFPLTIFLATASLCAQGAATPAPAGDLYGWWAARTNVIQSRQPNWAVPLVTTYTGLFQVVRTDIVRQTTPALTQTWNLDNSKGVNLILSNWTEVAVDLPPFIRHNSTAADGFGDMSFLGKVRLVSGNAQHGDYVVSVFALATIPTGSYKNGSTDATIAPNLGIGKGFGRFDVQSTLGATLPVHQPAISVTGHPIAWNAAAQYHAGKLFWPEIESNATFFKGGANDGKTQEFLTPGLLIGKCGLHPADAKSRPGLAFGGGVQIATSHFHTYNHGIVLTTRWIF
jgi:hypothetical protein